MTHSASMDYEGPPRMSPPVFCGFAHDGGCIFVPTPRIPTPPLVHVDPTMATSSPAPHEEAVQIERIPAEDIEPVEGLQRSRCPLAHALDCGTSDDFEEEVYVDQWHNQVLCSKSFIRVSTMLGAMTIRAFEEEDRFFAKNLELIDRNVSPFFHSFATNEWLIQRLETLSAVILASSALYMVLLPPGTFSSGFIGMALSYGLSLNTSLVFSIQNQCTLANYVISVERLNQYMHIPSEAPKFTAYKELHKGIIDFKSKERKKDSESDDKLLNSVDYTVLGASSKIAAILLTYPFQIRYGLDALLVLRGISCTFERGHKLGIVGRTGSGKTTLIDPQFIVSDLNVIVEVVGFHAGASSQHGSGLEEPHSSSLEVHLSFADATPLSYNTQPCSVVDDLDNIEVLGATHTHDVGGSSHAYEHVQAYMDEGIDINANRDVYEEFIDTNGLMDDAEVLDGPQIKNNEEDCPTIVPIPEWFTLNTWDNINDPSPALGTGHLTSWHKGDQSAKGMLFKNKASVQYVLSFYSVEHNKQYKLQQEARDVADQ
nr:abc transporter c family member 10 [Quercus suber]